MNNTMLSRFGFHCLPFTREIQVAERFTHEVFDRPLQYLLRAVDKRMSAALIAPSGTGKTMLLRALMDGLPESRCRVRYVKVTDLSKRDLCREIGTAVGIEPAGNYPTLVRRLQERFSNDLDVDAVRPVLFHDLCVALRNVKLGSWIFRILGDCLNQLHISIVRVASSN
ncbi:MAG: ATP-binding protein [bacterium]|nr:ATP-binding protein [bacterium]